MNRRASRIHGKVHKRAPSVGKSQMSLNVYVGVEKNVGMWEEYIATPLKHSISDMVPGGWNRACWLCNKVYALSSLNVIACASSHSRSFSGAFDAVQLLLRAENTGSWPNSSITAVEIARNVDVCLRHTKSSSPPNVAFTLLFERTMWLASAARRCNRNRAVKSPETGSVSAFKSFWMKLLGACYSEDRY